MASGPELATYGFGEGHPFGHDRQDAFTNEIRVRGLDAFVHHCDPVLATEEEVLAFHTRSYYDLVKARSRDGHGYLDQGDTPAEPGIFEAASWVVGTTLSLARGIMAGAYRRAFTPIGGLHHAARDTAAGFCVFNDAGVVVERLRTEFGLERIAYVDIDAHHGDGVFYGFQDDPGLIFADLHEDGRFLYPGTGSAAERGVGAAEGTKLNIPMPPGAGDAEFLEQWKTVEAFLRSHQPQFILMQCGADSLTGDPITHLRYSERAHGHAAERLCALADEFCEGRLLAMGGGGYNRANLARAWTAVVASLVDSTATGATG
jgi:acetoin utilization protein AcuC